MKIGIFSHDQKLFSEHDKKFISILESSDLFWTIIRKAREKNNIPEHGLPITVKIKNKRDTFLFNNGVTDLKLFRGFIENQKKYIKLNLSARYITQFYNLPKNWVNLFFSIILINYVLPLKSEYKDFEYEYIGGFKSLLEKQSPKIVIKIRENISIKEIKKLLDENKKEIKRYLSYLPLSPNRNQRLKLQKNIALKKRITNYQKIGKSYKIIANDLEKEFGKDKISFNTDSDQLSTYKGRFKDFTNSLVKNKIMLLMYFDDKLG
jgi:hypothetical protein